MDAPDGDNETEIPPPTLDLATWDEICGEIRKRFKSALVVTVEDPEDAEDEFDPVNVRVFGGQLNAIGMARYAEKALMRVILGQKPEEE